MCECEREGGPWCKEGFLVVLVVSANIDQTRERLTERIGTLLLLLFYSFNRRIQSQKHTQSECSSQQSVSE